MTHLRLGDLVLTQRGELAKVTRLGVAGVLVAGFRRMAARERGTS